MFYLRILLIIFPFLSLADSQLITLHEENDLFSIRKIHAKNYTVLGEASFNRGDQVKLTYVNGQTLIAMGVDIEESTFLELIDLKEMKTRDRYRTLKASAIALNSEYIFLVHENNLYIISRSKGVKERVVSLKKFSDEPIRQIEVTEKYVFFLGSNGLYRLELSNTAKVTAIPFEEGKGAHSGDFNLQNKRIYLVTPSGRFSVIDPTNLRQEGEGLMLDPRLSFSSISAGTPPHAYLSLSKGGQTAYLQKINIKEIGRINQYPIGKGKYQLLFSGNLIYLYTQDPKRPPKIFNPKDDSVSVAEKLKGSVKIFSINLNDIKNPN